MHELLRYGVVGVGAVVTDYLTYVMMLDYLMLDASLAKGISYILGALFAFAMNKMWTFKSDIPAHKAFGKFSMLYFSTFVTNVGINALLLWSSGSTTVAFGVATATSVILNYLGQKFWVFRG
ncbi:MAG TPA: GtrA family protein [Clostridiales bacterium UBA8960]|jgi:putative flippase GtrA|nr:GtrA family protein [Clostridiales bacterium UBA8960]